MGLKKLFVGLFAAISMSGMSPAKKLWLSLFICGGLLPVGCSKIESFDPTYISPDVYSGSTNALNHLPNGNKTLTTDFVLGEPNAVSNAIVHHGPPDGWDIVCDGLGHYSPRNGSFVVDIQTCGFTNVRTNHFQAVVAAWRTKEIWDAPAKETETSPHTTNDWKTCMESK